MSRYTRTLSTILTPTVTSQREAIPGRESEMTVNNAGGFSFSVDKWTQLDRFLILGTEGGTYYVQERPLTLQSAKNVQECIKEDGLRAVTRIVEISDSGRAPKNDQALFALAIAAAADAPATRQAALAALPKVARIGTHLFHFAEFVKNFRGYGRGLRNAIANWYLNMPVDRLALQAIKYQQRDGWSHRDMLRLAHPHTRDELRNNLFKFMVATDAKFDVATSNTIIEAYQRIQKLDKSDVKTAVKLITDNRLPREAVPTEFLNSVDVWAALLVDMPLTAMVRNLGKMTNIGLLAPMSDASKKVVETLTNEQALRKARVHPMAILNALKVYNNGGGFRGKLTWTPDQRIVDALDAAFYGSFGNVTPTGKNVMLAIDCSGSMGCNVSGSEVLSCRDAAAAMALITANVESNYEIVGFSNGSGYTVNGGKSRWCTYGSGINTLKISPRMRLDTVVNIMANFSWGGTDCALPMLYATGTKRPVDAFFVYTDNETWAGSIQPAQALVEYRKRSGRAAKLAVVGMAINNFTIADPKDAGMLDVVGFDTATPEVLSEFTRS